MPALFRNTILYVLVGFLPVAANFLLAPIYTKYLVPEQYALVGIATLLQTFLTFFISLSLDGAFSRLFFKYEKNAENKHALMSTLLLTVIILAIIISFLLFLAGNRFFSLLFSNPGFRFTNFGCWVVLTTSANVVFLFFTIWFRNEERLKSYIAANLIFFFVPVIGALTGLIFFHSGALGSVIGRAIGSVLVIVVMVAGYFRKKKPVLKKALIKESLKYSMPLVPYQLMFAAFLNIDRIILERRFTAHDFGVYNFAVMVSALVPIFINAISNAINPRIYRELEQESDPENVGTFNRFILLGTTLIICLCMAAVVPCMRLFINKEYADAYAYVASLLLSYLPYIHYLVFTIPFFYTGKTRPFPVISFIALMAGILFNYLFISQLGIWAVCLSLYVIRVTQMGISYLYVKKHGFHTLEYLKQKSALLVSFALIVAYNILLFINNHFKLVPVDIINITPLIAFLVFASFVYVKEVRQMGAYWQSIRKYLQAIKNK